MKVKELISVLLKCYNPEHELDITTLEGNDLSLFVRGIYDNAQEKTSHLIFEEIKPVNDEEWEDID